MSLKYNNTEISSVIFNGAEQMSLRFNGTACFGKRFSLAKNTSSGVSVIGAGAFAGCTKLERVNIPDSVKQIGKNAFYLCDELMRIEIPAGVEKVESAAFMLCNCLTIYCRSESRPLGWAEDWNFSCPAVWDCANN